MDRSPETDSVLEPGRQLAEPQVGDEVEVRLRGTVVEARDGRVCVVLEDGIEDEPTSTRALGGREHAPGPDCPQ